MTIGGIFWVRVWVGRGLAALATAALPGGAGFSEAAGAAGVESTELAARGPRGKKPLFEEVPAAVSGVDFSHRWTPPEKYAGIIDRAFAGGGVAIGDADGDGRPELFLTRPFGGGQLFRNAGGWRFENVTAAAGLAGEAANWSAGATWGDIDNDGDLDLYVCGFDCPNRLFQNDGRGRFRDIAREAGLAVTGASVMMYWADYDRDGDLDGYLVTNRAQASERILPEDRKRLADLERRLVRDRATGRLTVPEELRESFDIVVQADGRPTLVNAGQADRLFRQDGVSESGVPHFSDVTREAGVWDNGRGQAALWWDYDNDGHEDLYVANDFYGPDRLWRNQGDGTFIDVAAKVFRHTPWFSMGCDAGDLNNDGWLDFIATDMAGSNHYKDKMSMGDMDRTGWFLEVGEPRQYMRNALYLNSGGGHPFLEAAHMLRCAATDWTWAAKLGDLDCDGWVDLYVTNGMTGDFLNSDLRAAAGSEAGTLAGAPRKPDVHMAFRNGGGGSGPDWSFRFHETAAEWGLAREAISFGAAFGDLDLDGDLDLVVNNFDEPATIYRNAGDGGSCTVVRLLGRRTNRAGLGARVTLEAGGMTQTRHLTPGRGFFGCDEVQAHFATAKGLSIDRLSVHWPGGVMQTITDCPGGRRYAFREPEVGAANEPPPSSPRPLFQSSDMLANAIHRETAFDDFVDQPLLPNKLSHFGPGFAWADIDGDGDDDLFLGGGAGHAGQMFVDEGVGGGTGRFVARASGAFEADRLFEDMGALFLDAEGDGDDDLYVVSGGVEGAGRLDAYQDRLYLNDGRGGFARAPAALPAENDSGSAVAAADFDRDGDLDLFVGGRVVPGRYPLSPGSRLLRNESTRGEARFARVADAEAPGLSSLQRVTGALWSDVEGDGWIDLVVSTEWGPIRIMRNTQSGRGGRARALVEESDSAGTAPLTGWWNGLAAGDLDGDGRIDFVATNFGMNTKYHPEPAHPARVYFGDFDGTGRPQLIEAKFAGADRLLPVRGKSCSQNALPFLRQKFPRFHDFASATLADIYTAERLEAAQRFEAGTLATGVFWNDSPPGGPIKLVFHPLPPMAQLAPAFGAAVLDSDGDTRPDIVLTQNFYHPQRETGRMAGGVGVVLTGDGRRGSQAQWPNRSGFVVAADARSLALRDLDDDRRLDLVAAVNAGGMRTFTAKAGRPAFVVRLTGASGNRFAAGARLTLTTSRPRTAVVEATAGDGHLAQSAADHFFSLADGETPASLSVRWPDGTASDHVVDPTATAIEIKHPHP